MYTRVENWAFDIGDLSPPLKAYTKTYCSRVWSITVNRREYNSNPFVEKARDLPVELLLIENGVQWIFYLVLQTI